MGFAGLTSSSGAFLSVAGADFGGGPSSVSGVGVGAGATRRGRDDCACKEIVARKIRVIAKTPKAEFPALGIRLLMARILSDLHRNLQMYSANYWFARAKYREEVEAIFGCRKAIAGSPPGIISSKKGRRDSSPTGH